VGFGPFLSEDGIHRPRRKNLEKVLEKLRRHLLQTAEDKDLDVTFSIGAVAFPQAPDSVDEMIAAADKTMYSVGKLRCPVWRAGRSRWSWTRCAAR
jgi:GGDEF domain-containing protein